MYASGQKQKGTVYNGNEPTKTDTEMEMAVILSRSVCLFFIVMLISNSITLLLPDELVVPIDMPQ